MEVYLRSDSTNEVLLGTVEEIISNSNSGHGGPGMSFRAIISDIIANMLPEENQVTFDIILR